MCLNCSASKPERPFSCAQWLASLTWHSPTSQWYIAWFESTNKVWNNDFECPLWTRLLANVESGKIGRIVFIPGQPWHEKECKKKRVGPPVSTQEGKALLVQLFQHGFCYPTGLHEIALVRAVIKTSETYAWPGWGTNHSVFVFEQCQRHALQEKGT